MNRAFLQMLCRGVLQCGNFVQIFAYRKSISVPDVKSATVVPFVPLRLCHSKSRMVQYQLYSGPFSASVQLPPIPNPLCPTAQKFLLPACSQLQAACFLGTSELKLSIVS